MAYLYDMVPARTKETEMAAQAAEPIERWAANSARRRCQATTTSSSKIDGFGKHAETTDPARVHHANTPEQKGISARLFGVSKKEDARGIIRDWVHRNNHGLPRCALG